MLVLQGKKYRLYTHLVCCWCMRDIQSGSWGFTLKKYILIVGPVCTCCSICSVWWKQFLRERCTVSSCQLQLRKSTSRRRGWWGPRTNWRIPIARLNTLEMKKMTWPVECSPMWVFHTYTISKQSVMGKPLLCTGSRKLFRSQCMSSLLLSKGVGLAKPQSRELCFHWDLHRDCGGMYEFNIEETMHALFVPNIVVSFAWQGLETQDAYLALCLQWCHLISFGYESNHAVTVFLVERSM